MKDYSNPSRKPMMYGGESRTKAQMGGMQASSDTNMRPNRMNKDESGRNYQMAMTAANMQNRTKMAMGGKTEEKKKGMMYGGKGKKK